MWVEELELDDKKLTFSPGINLITGENGSGKTRVLNAIAAALDPTRDTDTTS